MSCSACGDEGAAFRHPCLLESNLKTHRQVRVHDSGTEQWLRSSLTLGESEKTTSNPGNHALRLVFRVEYGQQLMECSNYMRSIMQLT